MARSNALKSLDADRYPRIRFRENDIDETGDGYRLRLTWQRLADSGNTSLRAVVHAAAVEAKAYTNRLGWRVDVPLHQRH